jgi:hypothetical protein
MQYYGAGVQACYRGPRLYDTEETRRVVANTIQWYKKYRAILNEQLVHLRRADGRDWDGWLHVSSTLKNEGLVMLFNPTNEPIKTEIKLPLYYTGLTKASVREKEGVAKSYTLERGYNIKLPVELKPQSYSWWVVE